MVFGESGVDYLGSRPVLPTIGPGTGDDLISSTTNGNGDPVVFVVSADGALWENDPPFAGTGWEEISQPGGFTFISADEGRDRRPGGVRRHRRRLALGERRRRRILGADIGAGRIHGDRGHAKRLGDGGGLRGPVRRLLVGARSGLRLPLARGPRPRRLHGAGRDARRLRRRRGVVVPSDGSLWEYDAAFSYPWLEVSTPGGFTAISAMRDASGALVLFAVPGDGSLWELASGVWLDISAPGGFTAIGATQDASGDAVVYAVPSDGSLWEHDPAFSGQPVGGDLRPGRLHGDRRGGEPFPGPGGVLRAGRLERLGEQPGLRRLDADLRKAAGGAVVPATGPSAIPQGDVGGEAGDNQETVTGLVDPPADGCEAFFGVLDYEIDGIKYHLCVQMRVAGKAKP